MKRAAADLPLSALLTARRAARALIVFVLLAIVSPMIGSTAQAQESNAQFWLQERALQQRVQSERQSRLRRQQHMVLYQRPTHLIRRAKPVRGFTLSIPAPAPAVKPVLPNPKPPVAASPPAQAAPGAAVGAPGVTSPAAAAGASPQRSAPPVPVVQKEAPPGGRVFTIAVIGDSLGQFLEQGLSDFYADRSDIVILKRARESTGLVREDYFNWVQAAKDLASGKEHIDMAIMMLGSNDHQPIHDSSGTFDPLSPRWSQIYADRVGVIAAAFRDKKIPFLWVGAPIMRSGSLSDAMLAFNDIYKATVEQNGGTYLDVWDLFADDSGRYALYGPDVNGDIAKLRSSDGVHFTRAGALKLAQFVEPEIKRIMDGARPQADAAIAGVAPQVALAEPVPQSAQALSVPEKVSRRTSNDLLSLVPAPAAPIQPVIPIRPAAGPVLALTTPVVAPDGKLVTRALVQSSAEGETVEHTLADGAPIQPRPGRADDFRWPRD